MRRLIALLGALMLAGAAHAQTQIICLQAQSQWDRAAASGNGAAMLRVAAHIPPNCPGVRRQAETRLAALQAQYTQQQQQQRRIAEQHTQPKPAPTDSAATGRADDQTQLAALTPPAPAAPAAPCSVEDVQSRFPNVPVLARADPSRTQGGRSELAGRYIERGDAFHQCHDDAQALADYRDAEALDPRAFSAFVAQGDLELDGKDYPAAVDAYDKAIGVAAAAGPDDNVLTAYAGRAEAEAALGRYPDEIRDLTYLTANYAQYNHDQAVGLEQPSYYHEQLGKAYYLTHNDEAAAAEFLNVEAKDLDWQDLRFLAARSLQAGASATAIEQLKQGLGEMAGDEALKPQKAQIEVMMAQAYLASGDQPDALDHYKIAEAYDPGNADAHAGHQRIGDPPPPPTFQDPVLAPVTPPAGVSDLAQDTPAPFCGQAAKNAYLDSINAATDAVNANVTTIGRVSEALLTQRAVYDGDKRLTYGQKIEDLALFDDQLKKLRIESKALYDEGQALVAFFHRVNDDRSNVIGCR